MALAVAVMTTTMGTASGFIVPFTNNTVGAGRPLGVSKCVRVYGASRCMHLVEMKCD
jgi:hypothetical protein